MKHLIAILLLYTCSSALFGQIKNLVPNGDFEDISFCFEQIDGLKKVPHWSAAVPPGLCSSDYYNKCQLNHQWLPKFPIKYINGNASAAFSLKTTVPYHREYIQCNLVDALKEKEEYIIEFKIRPIYWSGYWEWGVNRVEILFAINQPLANIYNLNTPSRIDTIPSIVFEQTFLDTNLWYSCKSKYTALGNERFLTIGIFSHDTAYSFLSIGQIMQTQWKNAYYLIDDVMLYKASDTIKQLPEPVLPNVFSPNGDGVNEVYEIENLPEKSTLEVFNRWGAVVFIQAPYQNNWPGNAPNGNPVADGVYFAILTYQDVQGNVQQKKQTVHVVR